MYSPMQQQSHNDRVSSSHEPVNAWLCELPAGGIARHNLRGPKFVPDANRSPHYAKRNKIGTIMSDQFTVEAIDINLPEHGDWLIIRQIHGVREQGIDSGTAQSFFSFRNRNGVVQAHMRITGDTREVTRMEEGHLSDLATDVRSWHPEFDVNKPIHFQGYTQWGLEGGASRYRIHQDIGDSRRIGTIYSRGPNFFPVVDEPETAGNNPTFGVYRSKSIVHLRQAVLLTNVKVNWS